MTLAAGQRISFYEILGSIGAGGMGEVYRARDTRLEREVAIKVLPEELADDEERLRRFEREAKTLAALHHPNVASIFGIDQVDDTCFIAMELVAGEDLSERLRRGPLPVDEAVDICRQIAEGLEAAHEAGVVHRDLKPANVRITPDGVAKVLDFGLAKAAGPDASSGSSTVAAEPDSFVVTEEGMVLGTPTYMSPEQARARPVDRRTDIWAFGCVLYECLTGRRAFAGESFSDIIAAVIGETPDLAHLPAGTPPHVRRLLARCLEKDARLRLRDIGEARVALGSAEPEPVKTAAPSAPSSAGASSLLRGPLGWAIGALLGGLATFAVIGPLAPSDGGAVEPAAVRTLTYSGDDSMPSASPDGRLVAFDSARDGRSRIWLKLLDTGGEQVLTDGPDVSPRFAPDGTGVLFLRAEGDRQSVYRQALVGGDARKIVDDAVDACWSPDGTRIGFLRALHGEDHQRFALLTADVRTREERELFRSDTQLYAVHWSPDGRALSTGSASLSGQSVDSELVVVPVDGGEVTRHTVAGPAILGHDWVGDGRRVVYAQSWYSTGDQGGSLSRMVLWDLEDGWRRDLFHAEYLFANVGTTTVGRGATVDVVADGTLVFDTAFVRQTLWEQELRDGKAVGPGRNLLVGESRDRQPVYSPDGSRIRFASNRSGNLDLWEMDLASGRLRQLTDDRAQDWDPAFAADGEGLLWSSDRGGAFEIWAANADGSGARQLSDDGVDAENPAVAPGGEWIVYWSANLEKLGIWRVRNDGSERERVAAGDYLQSDISDDGRWAGFLIQETQNLRNRLRVVELETGRVVPFEIEVRMHANRAQNVTLGRMRWISAGPLAQGPAIAFVGMDDRGRTGVYLQEFDPERDTTDTRRPLAGFHDQRFTESFDIASDGSRIALSLLEIRRKLMLAEGVEGIEVPRAGSSR